MLIFAWSKQIINLVSLRLPEGMDSPSTTFRMTEQSKTVRYGYINECGAD
jgi:hypothetical protein